MWQVFGHVVYHIIKAPSGAGDTQFAHLGIAYDKLPNACVQARLRRCASVNSNGGAVHPLACAHPLSGRISLYLHLGMTGAMIETLDAAGAEHVGSGTQVSEPSPFGDGTTPADLPGPKPGAATATLLHVRAWRDAEMDSFFTALSDHLDRPDVSYSHKWQQGDVVVIDNLAVAHKAAPGAHTLASGLRILHRTTVLSARPHDPPPELKLPHTLPTDGPCPFEKGATWAEGYVGTHCFFFRFACAHPQSHRSGSLPTPHQYLRPLYLHCKAYVLTRTVVVAMTGFRWGQWDKRATPH